MGKEVHEDTDTAPELKSVKGGQFREWIRSLLQQQFLFQFAMFALLVACIYSEYTSIRILERTIEELKTENKLLRTENSRIASEVRDVKTELHTIEEDVNNIQQKVDNLQTKSTKTEIAIKEIFKNSTMTESELDKHNSSIQHLLNITRTLNESQVNINTLQVSINRRLSELSCQSGYEIGAHDYPTRLFPYDVTIKFDPPFHKTPAFAYGITLLDALKHLAVNTHLISLTEQSFSLRIISWGAGELYGARISWIACPK